MSLQKLLAATTALTLLSVSPAFAAKYECERVDSIARLGTYDGDRVTIEEGNKDKKTRGKFCAFSVDGIAASSPPSERVKAALERLNSPLLGGARENEWDRRIEDIAYALISASDLQSPPDILIQFLRENKNEIHTCYEYFYDQTPMDDGPRTFNSFGQGLTGLCFVASSGKYGIAWIDGVELVSEQDLPSSAASVTITQSRLHVLVGVAMEDVLRLSIHPWNQ